LLAAHGVMQPRFTVVPLGSRLRRPRSLAFPLFVKSTSEDASLGISQESIVSSDAALADRVAYIHDEVGTDALVEGFIAGRELYVGVLGNNRPTLLPAWELLFDNLEPGHANIATEQVKWDYAWQRRVGLKTRAAVDLSPEVRARLLRQCRRVYRLLGMSGYARLDFRLAADGQAYLLEANPNPNLTFGEDFAESAEAAGIAYGELLERILKLGLAYRPEWKAFA
jgi:D-alanine-D-alanine ligase